MMQNREELQEVICKERITTFYQPIIDFSRFEIIGFEALSRGPQDTEFENPYILFDAAAEAGLLLELDSLCRKKALQNAQGLSYNHKLFINCLPSVVLDPQFRDAYLKSLLEELRLTSLNIVFEINERNAIEYFDLFNQTTKYYTNPGFAIAVDDTGPEFSSLETVRKLKPRFVKLDISLVRGIDKNPLKQKLIKAIQSLANQMSSMVIAQCIETEAELATLMQVGIKVGQGFLFAKPGPAFPDINRPTL